MWLLGLPSNENQPEQTITHPCRLREGRDGLASSCLAVPSVGYGPGVDGPDREGGNTWDVGAPGSGIYLDGRAFERRVVSCAW
jgi:hypothetical protein